MTRINAGVLPEELPTKQLIAEHREIKRIPNLIKLGKLSDIGVPEEFTLGTGHIKFFRNKQGYLRTRYAALYLECRRRGFNVQCYHDSWNDVPWELMGGWEATPRDREILLQRFAEKGIVLLKPCFVGV